LDGSASSDPDGNTLTYLWTAPAGITLSSATAQKPGFTAPEVKKDSVITFTLVVNDGFVVSQSATVKINVQNIIKVGLPELVQAAFKIYPNPTAGDVFIEIDEPINKPAKIEIYNSAGSIVRIISIANSELLKIDLSQMSNGLYYLRMQTDSRLYSGKIVIKK
jgi:hypothetical protein